MARATTTTTVTMDASVSAGLYYVDQADSTYLAIGKTTPWINESAPPAGEQSTSVLQEVIGYKKADKVSLCKPVLEGESTPYPTVNYGGKTYALIPKEKAYQERATLVYFETEVAGTDLPTGTYRQVGMHTGLIPKSGVNKKALLPTEVQSTGVLQFFANKENQNRTVEVRVKERFILSVGNLQEII